MLYNSNFFHSGITFTSISSSSSSSLKISKLDTLLILLFVLIYEEGILWVFWADALPLSGLDSLVF